MAGKRKQSILTEFTGYCIICGRPCEEMHHLMSGTANRALADADGLVIPLCREHHNSSNMSVHMNREMKVLSRIVGQLAWEKEYYKNLSGVDGDEARELFRGRYGKSYL